MNFKDIWYSAEEVALKFTKLPACQRIAEVLTKIVYTVILFLICVGVFTYMVAKASIEMLPKRKTKEEDEPMEYEWPDKVEGTKDGEPEVIKKMRETGQL